MRKNSDTQKLAASKSSRSVLTDERLGSTIDILKKMTMASEAILGGDTTMRQACDEAGLDWIAYRKCMNYILDKIYDPKSPEMKNFYELEWEPNGIELLYIDILQLNKTDYEQLWQYLPENGMYIYLETAESELSRREDEVIRSLYFEGLSLEETGNMFGITKERVRQIQGKALRKLRHPQRLKKLLHGTKAETVEYFEKLKQETVKHKNEQAKINMDICELNDELSKTERLLKDNYAAKEELQQQISVLKGLLERKLDETVPLEELDFSVRTYNCLRRYGVTCLQGLAKIPFSNLCVIRNMGVKSLCEVITVCKEHGVTVPGTEKLNSITVDSVRELHREMYEHAYRKGEIR